MFSTNKYSKRTISTFEIIGSFVVDVYYNHLYAEAKKLHAFSKVESTTEGYKCAMSTYIRSLSHPEHYKKTLLGIHRYYSTTTKFTNIPFSDCMNNISKQFMPEDLHESMSESQKDGMIRVVLSAAIKQFSAEILKGKLLRMIIDDHDSDGIVRTLQDAMVECLVFEREKLYQKIFSSQNGVSKDGGVSSKMRKTIESLMAENKLAAATNEKLTAKVKLLEQKVSQCVELLKKQRETINAHSAKAHDEPRHDPRHDPRWHEPVKEVIKLPFDSQAKEPEHMNEPPYRSPPMPYVSAPEQYTYQQPDWDDESEQDRDLEKEQEREPRMEALPADDGFLDIS
jgi:hypothetical protein